MKQIYKLSEDALKCYESLDFFKLLLDDSNSNMEDKLDIIKAKCIGNREFSLFIVKKFLK